MRWSVLLAVACFPALLASPVTGQTAQTISIQGSLLGAALGGDAFEADGITFEAGSGFEAQVRYNPSALSFGAGYQYTLHPVTVTGAEGVDVSLDFAGLFLEPRYVIFIGSERAAPYVSARLMRLLATLRIPEISFEEDFDAWGYNVGGGLLFRLSSRMNVDVGLTVGGITFVYEEPDVESDSGSSAVFRVGLALGL